MTLLNQDDHTAGRDLYGDHTVAWQRLRFTDPDHPTDPAPANKLYNFIDGDSENDDTGAGATDRDDVYRGGDGSDHFSGKRGDDHLFGQNGTDALTGDQGNDFIYGGEGFDIGHGNEGNDSLWGDEDADVLSGEQGEDTLSGGEGQDNLSGGDGPDLLYGDAGRDWLDGGEGNDSLFGGADNDTQTGGPGDDQQNGGEGSDLFRFDTGHGHDRILNFEPGIDRISVRGVADSAIRYTGDGVGSTLVTWGDPSTDVVLVGISADAFA
jgi:Ca2+-binding RTX toxin-like protein